MKRLWKLYISSTVCFWKRFFFFSIDLHQKRSPLSILEYQGNNVILRVVRQVWTRVEDALSRRLWGRRESRPSSECSACDLRESRGPSPCSVPSHRHAVSRQKHAALSPGPPPPTHPSLSYTWAVKLWKSQVAAPSQVTLRLGESLRRAHKRWKTFLKYLLPTILQINRRLGVCTFSLIYCYQSLALVKLGNKRSDLVSPLLTRLDEFKHPGVAWRNPGIAGRKAGSTRWCGQLLCILWQGRGEAPVPLPPNTRRRYATETDLITRPGYKTCTRPKYQTRLIPDVLDS